MMLMSCRIVRVMLAVMLLLSDQVSVILDLIQNPQNELSNSSGDVGGDAAD